MFVETPPFAYIFGVKWTTEGWTNTWVYSFVHGNEGTPISSAPSPQCYPVDHPLLPEYTQFYLAALSNWSWHLVPTEQNDLIDITGAPSLSSGSVGSANSDGIQYLVENEVGDFVPKVTIGESADFTVSGSRLLPVGCYGNDGVPGGIDPPLFSIYGGPMVPEPDLDMGTVTASGISATLDGAPLLKVRTVITFSTGLSISVAVTWARMPS